MTDVFLEVGAEFPPAADVFHGGGDCACVAFQDSGAGGSGFSLGVSCLPYQLRGKRGLPRTLPSCPVLSVLTTLSPHHKVVLSACVRVHLGSFGFVENRDDGASFQCDLPGLSFCSQSCSVHFISIPSICSGFRLDVSTG